MNFATIRTNIFHQFARREGTSPDNQGVRIYVYHSLSRSNSVSSVPLSLFTEHMEILSRSSTFLSLAEIVQGVRTGESLHGVAITFDDGYQDVLQALPITKKYNIPVALFAVANTKKVQRKEMSHSGKLLTMKELRTLSGAGWTIGCHSETHANIETLDLDDIFREVTIAKHTLENALECPVPYFAYPNGKYTVDVVQAVKYADYQAGFTLSDRPISSESNIYTLPRMVIDRSISIPEYSNQSIGTVERIRQIASQHTGKHVYET